MSARSRQLRRHLAVRGGTLLWAMASADVMAQAVVVHTVTTGPHYYANNLNPSLYFKVGADGYAGLVAPASHGKCRGGPTPGGVGANGAGVDQTVTYTPGKSTFAGTLVVVGSTGGNGGHGGNGDPGGHCGKGDFYGSAGGNGGNVQLTVNPDPAAPETEQVLSNTAIVALSRGGNGGDGGNNTRAKGGYSGGDGGAAGKAGSVSLSNNVSLRVTGGETAYGLLAQSAGGQGGEGGSSDNGKAKGGSGLPGGAGGAVTIINYGTITTAGGIAVAGQSIGGFGGDAGLNTKGYGGGGGFGGNGGAVSITNRGVLVVGNGTLVDCTDSITSKCNPVGSYGLAAQSVGGGGGNAGAAAGLTALGASGGTAGIGSTVKVSNSEDISIFGLSSIGVFAQSIGGGGGSGGMAFSSGKRTTAIGGSGGAGGNGGAVTVGNSADICTGAGCSAGKEAIAVNDSAGGAIGILAQSIGGGGGIGGFASAKGKTKALIGNSTALAVGGSGGSGGDGHGVAVRNSGSITTVEISSPGILAQSIGGGGGAAGGAVASARAIFGNATAVSHGGTGGSGGDGGTVAVNCNSYSIDASSFSACIGQGLIAVPSPKSMISTAGIGSPGIVAQSIGYGGGAGGYAMSLSGSLISSASLGLGGSGGGAGQGGVVFAGTDGVQISTRGIYSPGLLAQSVGGGGGSGGSTTDLSLAFVGSSVSVAIGGKAGKGNAGSVVMVENPGGVITTLGDGSQGIAAQSIGGGGGNGGSAITFAASGMYAASVSVGGSGGSGGVGSSVTVLNKSTADDARFGSGAISTSGYAASAILAQSIGGGGGNGGYTVALAGSRYEAGAASVGGNGGAGNNAGTVRVTNHGVLTTTGGGSAALLAQSIGGGGGSGGYAYAGSLAGIGAISVGIGGAGASGATGGAVSVSNTGAIISTATKTGNAPGILAQSIGGGGGSGGFAAAGSAALIGSASVAVGGGGGNGGKSAAVTVKNLAGITAAGPMSSGIVAQSVGGNGGTGGFALAGGAAAGIGVAAAIGGGGGNGGTAGDVTLNSTGTGRTVSTTGAQSTALIAQSIGGSGGMGGWSVATAIGGLIAPSISLGGAGGSGGLAGAVSVNSGETLFTDGLLSAGILAQSIGGSGGGGGFSAAASGTTIVALATAIGGKGGNGSKANLVDVTASGSIITLADQSVGIIAQSIGGNGGSGGSALSASASTGNPKSVVSVGAAGAVGGNGGSGQIGNKVTVTSSSGIQTSGYESIGIVAQSIGGSGGNGGSSAAFSASASGSKPDSKSISASVAVGGLGAAGGVADQVSVLMAGSIVTGAAAKSGGISLGDQSTGILAQSIGGSGGNGGSAYANAISGTASVALAIGGGGALGGNGGVVLVCSNSSAVGCNPAAAQASAGIATYGNLAAAIHAQSVGGGGGNGGASTASATSNKYAAAVAVGGFGAGGGNASAVTVNAGATLATAGAQSSGIFAQSVGGGGGNGGSASSSAAGAQGAVKAALVAAYTGFVGQTVGDATVSVADKFSQASGALSSQPEKSDNGAGVALSIGGAAGKGGNGSAVVVNSAAQIQTLGDLSYGIFAQSVGGGGGNGGSSTSNADGGNSSASVSLGGSGAVGGNGAVVSVRNSNRISTAGTQALGVFAQSIGGGGGNGGSATSSATAGGKAAVSFGLGGSGAGGGAAGAVTIANSSLITTLGSNSAGLFAQSVGGGGGNGGAASSAATVAEAEKDSDDTSASTGNVANAPKGASNSASAGTAPAVKGSPTSKGSAAGADSGYAVGLSLGGAGGAGSAGAAVTVANSGNIMTGAANLTNGAVNSQAIFAQSVGGGGGNGGSASSNADAGKASVALSMGGIGAGAGDGGKVVVTSSGSALLTFADNSAAIFAQSVGGGGGSGGSSASTSGNGGSVSAAMGLGGSGAGGGDGGAVSVCGVLDSSGACSKGISGNAASGMGIVTYGANASGVFAQSVGGGGGFGGAVSTAAAAKSDSSSAKDNHADSNSSSSSASAASGVAMSAGLGGSGGGGGDGGAITVMAATAIATHGDLAAAIHAQSVGGGGGVGGASNTNASSGAYAVDFSLGGSGGKGGIGGVVSVNNAGALATQGTMSFGLLAQSVGGGGGVAGSSSSSATDGGNASVSMALGGSAGSGQRGGSVTVTSDGTIATGGDGANAILAQSIGGGGGAGGASSSSASKGKLAAALALGGSGGAAGDGGAVSVSYSKSMATAGANAVAILAQSVGGGGGVGGASNASSAESSNLTASLALGGSGNSSGAGGAVSVTNRAAAAIVTAGVNSAAIVAQSIGGGGGAGGSALTSSSGGRGISLALGGHGAGASAGGAVTLNLGVNGSALTTYGMGSFGVVAQSIGGGGGIGATAIAYGGHEYGRAILTGSLGGSGGSGGSGGNVSLTSNQIIATYGLQSAGLLAQSVGGGGGVAAAAASNGSVLRGTMALGGNAGSEGRGGNVALRAAGSISTSAAMAPGIVAQSIGGGGGLSVVRSTEAVLGGASNGVAGAVTVNNSAAITTSGAASIGIVAQSIAGGGGLAFASEKATLGGAPSGANGGVVAVTSNATIRTSGINAIGILAQSVGGGGGAVLSTGDKLTPVFDVGVGHAGTVTVNVNADITTSGAGAYGIIAQSVSGGGGLVLGNGDVVLQGGVRGNSGLVTVNVADGVTIAASGKGAVGIRTWSSTDPIVNIGAGASVLGGSGGSAIVFEGPTNELNNRGSVASADGATGMAVHTVTGDMTLRNSGTLQGNLKLATGANNLVHNQGAGTILAGALLDLGGSGVLQNDGVLKSAMSSSGTTQINGSLAQSATGSLVVRIDHAKGVADAFRTSGSMQLLGTLRPKILNGGDIVPGTMSLGNFLSSDSTIDVSRLAIAQTAIMNYSLSTEGGAVKFLSNANFSPAGLHLDGQKIGQIVAAAQRSGSQKFRALTAALVEIETLSQLRQGYWHLSGAGVASMATVGEQMTTSFMKVQFNRFGAADTMLQPEVTQDQARNRTQDRTQNQTSGSLMRNDPQGNSRIDSDWSSWAQFYGDSNRTDADLSAGGSDLSARTYGVAVGRDYRVTPDTVLGFALGGGGTRFDLSNSLSGHSDAFQVGLNGSQRLGAAYASAALSYSWHHMTTARSPQVIDALYKADFQAHSLGARVETGYHFAALGITPYAALQAQNFRTPAYSESVGAGSFPHLALNYGARSASAIRTELGASWDTLFALKSGAALAVRTRLAWLHDHANNPDVEAAFQTLAGTDFRVRGTAAVPNAALLSTRAEWRLSNRVALGARLEGELASRSRTYTGMVTLRYQW